MHIKKTNIKAQAILSLIVGFLVAILTRLSLIVFATDFSYVKIGNLVFLPHDHLYFISKYNLSTEMFRYLGKKVVGVGGLPFSTFSKCFLKQSAFLIIPICDRFSTLGEFSILLNTAVWSVVLFYIINLFSKIYQRRHNLKETNYFDHQPFYLYPCIWMCKIPKKISSVNSVKIPVVKVNQVYTFDLSYGTWQIHCNTYKGFTPWNFGFRYKEF